MKVLSQKFVLSFHVLLTLITFFTSWMIKGVSRGTLEFVHLTSPSLIRGPLFIYAIIFLLLYLFVCLLTIIFAFVKRRPGVDKTLLLGSILSVLLIFFLMFTEATDTSLSPAITFQLFPILTVGP